MSSAHCELDEKKKRRAESLHELETAKSGKVGPLRHLTVRVVMVVRKDVVKEERSKFFDNMLGHV